MNEATKITAAHPNVYVALAAAQAEMEPLTKDAANAAFKRPDGSLSRYADLAGVVDAVRPALTRHGIAYFHQMAMFDEKPAMRTVLVHGASDTRIECDVPLIVQKNDMQGMKSATTYAKRIGLESVTGIAPEDDDGNAAAKAAPVVERPINISADQFVQLMGMIESTASDPAKLAQWLGVKMLEDLNVQQWERAMTQLRKKLAKGADDAAAQ